MHAPAIATRELTFAYRTRTLETTAVNAVTLDIAGGDYVAIQGPSGCGKSSLLSLFALIERPASGSLHLLDTDMADANESRRAEFRARHIGMVFQNFHLIPELSVIENLLLKLKYRDGGKHKSHHDLARQALDSLGLDARSQHYPDQLSGGQQQRVAIARAIVGSPKILLADEPTGNLDTRNSHQVMDIFDRIHADGVTVIMVTHNPEHAARAARQLPMSDGQLAKATAHV